jgi:host factor-I protein
MSTPIDVEISLPSIRNISNFVRDGRRVEVKLLTGDLLEGKLRWQDTNCICLVGADEQPILIWRHAIAYLKPKA